MWDLDLGPDWVMPLPVAESKPFAFAEHAKRFAAPEFAAGSSVKVERTKHKLGKKGDKDVKEIDVFKLTVPTAVQTFANRAFRYDVTVEAKDGKQLFNRHVLAPDYHLPLEKAAKDFVLPVPIEDLPKGGEVRFTAVALNCFGKSGKALTTDFFEV